MGNVARKLYKEASKPVREYNLYERAHKAAIKNKDIASPRHAGTDHLIETSIKNLSPKTKEELSQIDTQLAQRLQKVYVTSTGEGAPEQPVPRSTEEKPFPSRRHYEPMPSTGYVEPKFVPYGKTTLANAIDFITKHKAEPDVYTPEAIAAKHKLELEKLKHVLRHFGTFRVMVPRKDDPKLAQDDKDRLFIRDKPAEVKQLPLTDSIVMNLKGLPIRTVPSSDGKRQEIPIENIEPRTFVAPKKYREPDILDEVNVFTLNETYDKIKGHIEDSVDKKPSNGKSSSEYVDVHSRVNKRKQKAKLIDSNKTPPDTQI